MVIIAPSLNSLHADAVNNSTFPSKTKKCWKPKQKQINDCQYNSNSFKNMFKLTIVESVLACFFLAPGSIRTNPLLLPLVHGYNKYSTWFCFRSFSEPGYRISIERKEHRIECQYTNKQTKNIPKYHTNAHQSSQLWMWFMFMNKTSHPANVSHFFLEKTKHKIN